MLQPKDDDNAVIDWLVNNPGVKLARVRARAWAGPAAALTVPIVHRRGEGYFAAAAGKREQCSLCA